MYKRIGRDVPGSTTGRGVSSYLKKEQLVAGRFLCRFAVGSDGGVTAPRAALAIIGHVCSAQNRHRRRHHRPRRCRRKKELATSVRGSATAAAASLAPEFFK